VGLFFSPPLLGAAVGGQPQRFSAALAAEGLPEPQAARQQFWLAFAEQRRVQSALLAPLADLLAALPLGVLRLARQVRAGPGGTQPPRFPCSQTVEPNRAIWNR